MDESQKRSGEDINSIRQRPDELRRSQNIQASARNYQKVQTQTDNYPANNYPTGNPPNSQGVNAVPKSQDHKNLFLIIAIILVLVLLIGTVGFIIYNAMNSQRALSLGSDLKSAEVKSNKIAYISLNESLDAGNLSAIKIIFGSKDNFDYYYTPSSISTQYEISANDTGLESFKDITSVRIILEYKNMSEVIVNPINESTNSSQGGNQTTQNSTQGSEGSSSSGSSSGSTCTPDCTGKICGDDGCFGSCGICNDTDICQNGNCIVNCTNDYGCFSEGNFCDGDSNLVFNCTTNSSGCFERLNLTQCESGEQCINATCEVIPNCAVDSDCISYFQSCSYGICNASKRCELHYKITTCREAVNECDLPEICPGNVELCSAIDYKQPDGTLCSTGKCLSGNCVECILNSDCSSDGCYGAEYRNYFCNLNSCTYNVETLIENLTNDNCGDGKDNDCDGLSDSDEVDCYLIPEDYVSYYKFENNLNDETGSYNGTATSIVYNLDSEKGSMVINLNGAQFVRISSNSPYSPVDTVSVSAWVYLTSQTPSYPGIVWKNNSVILRYSPTEGNKVQAFVANETTAEPRAEIANTDYNKWHNFVMTYDSWNLRLYIDGTLANETQKQGPINSTGDDWFIGNYGGIMYTGKIDDVMIYNRSLSSSEVKQIYYLQKPFGTPSINAFSGFWRWLRDLFS